MFLLPLKFVKEERMPSSIVVRTAMGHGPMLLRLPQASTTVAGEPGFVRPAGWTVHSDWNLHHTFSTMRKRATVTPRFFGRIVLINKHTEGINPVGILTGGEAEDTTVVPLEGKGAGRWFRLELSCILRETTG